MLRSLAIRFAERVVMEALLVRLRRSRELSEDPLFLALVASAFVVVPAWAVAFAVWVLTGRGPGLRLVMWNAGSPRQRIRPPSRTAAG